MVRNNFCFETTSRCEDDAASFWCDLARAYLRVRESEPMVAIISSGVTSFEIGCD